MSRAYGWNAKLLIAEESTYGTLSSGPYTQVPFASSAIDSEQGLISSNVLGLGRDPTTPFQDVINVEGDLAVPVDLRNIGIWLKAVFGVPETISLLSNLSNVSVKAIPEKLNDKIMAIVWDGFKYYSYASFDENVRQLNQYWGSNINTSILSGYIDINGLKFNDVKLETVENISYDKMFNISSEVNGPGYGFGNRLLSILASSLDKGISSPIVKIEYKDRYLKNPLASGLFYSFIKELKVRYEKLWNCASITLETAETTETNKQYPTMFYHDWDDVDARNEVLTALFDKIGLKFQLKEKNKKYLEHNRIMTIELENGEKINLILDQGFSYWRCLAYCYAENIFPFDADIDEQVAKIGQWLPNVSGDTYPTRIFYTKSK